MLATKKIQILKKCKTCNAILSQWKGGSNVIQSVTRVIISLNVLWHTGWKVHQRVLLKVSYSFFVLLKQTGDYAYIMGFSVLFLDGPGHNTPDPWSSSNGLPTSTYPSMLPGNSHHSQAYPSMHHSHDMVRSSPVGNSDVRHSPGVMVAQWLGNNPPSSSSSSVPSSRHHPQQVGIAIGIAVYSCHHFLSAQCVMSRCASDFGLGEFFYSFSIKTLVVLMEISL